MMTPTDLQAAAALMDRLNDLRGEIQAILERIEDYDLDPDKYRIQYGRWSGDKTSAIDGGGAFEITDDEVLHLMRTLYEHIRSKLLQYGVDAPRLPSRVFPDPAVQANMGATPADPQIGPPWVVLARVVNFADEPERRVIVNYFRGWDAGVDVWNDNLELALRFYEEAEAQQIANVFTLLAVPNTIFNICTLDVARRFVLDRSRMTPELRAHWSALDLSVLKKQLAERGDSK